MGFRGCNQLGNLGHFQARVQGQDPQVWLNEAEIWTGNVKRSGSWFQVLA